MRACAILLLSVGSAMVLLGSIGLPARACDVSVGSEVVVHTGTPVMVRMAWDRSDDVPAVLWLDSATNEIAYSRWLGPDDASWETPTVVDKGTVHAPPGFDWGGWRMVALAFDGAGQPHLVIAGEETMDGGSMGLWYVHRMPEGSWTTPVEILELPANGFVQADLRRAADGAAVQHTAHTGL